MVDFVVIFAAAAFTASLFAVSFLRAIPGWLQAQREVRAVRHVELEPVIVWTTAPAEPTKLKDIVALGYAEEVVNAWARHLIIARQERKAAEKRAKAERTAERVAALHVKDVVRTAQTLARSERSRAAWARKKAAQQLAVAA